MKSMIYLICLIWSLRAFAKTPGKEVSMSDRNQSDRQISDWFLHPPITSTKGERHSTQNVFICCTSYWQKQDKSQNKLFNLLLFQEAKKACKLIKDRFGITEASKLTLNVSFEEIDLILANSTQVDEWIKDVDYDGDGQLSFEEFKFSLAGNLNHI